VSSPSPDADAAGTAATKRPLVLIVDDNEKNLKLARDVLRAAGFGTVEAASGAEGIALAGEHLPNVILMDLRLPDMDGAAAAQRLGVEARTASIPVVALSAVPLERGGGWLVAAGFAGCLEKPISVGEFPDQVRRYCSSISARGEGNPTTSGVPTPPSKRQPAR
jgi:two-component system cell cycle response regulator DivK